LGDIDPKVASALMEWEHWYLLSGLEWVSTDYATDWVWVSLAEDAIFVRLPVVHGTVAFGGIKGSARGSNELIPPLELRLHSLDECREWERLTSGRHCHVINKCFDAFKDSNGKCGVLHCPGLKVQVVCID